MIRLPRLTAIALRGLLLGCLFCVFTGNGALAAQQHDAARAAAKKNAAADKKAALHARPWIFSAPADRGAKQWQKGTDADELPRRAVAGNQPARSSVNTSSAIDAALERAERQNAKQGGLNVSIRNENASFKGAQSSPQDGGVPHAGETPLRTGRHIVGAFADVRSGEDMQIRLGPELILKNEQSLDKSAGNQPDSAVGMGMQFKLDF